MKTKSAETTKSTPTKKTPPSKKESDKKTPTTKPESTPKVSAPATTSTPLLKNTAKKSTPKSAPISKTKEETADAPKEVTPTAENKSLVKKVVRKTRSSPAAKTKASSGSSVKKEALVVEEPAAAEEEEPATVMEEELAVMEEEENTATKEEANDGLMAVEDVKEHGNGTDKVEEDPEEKPENEIDDEVEEFAGEERFEEPVEEECMEDDALERNGEEEEDEGRMMEEEQMQMSDVAKQRRQNKELEIFIGGLDRDTDEDDVKKAFEKVGEVVEVRLLRNPLTNKNKGFAFVKFATKEQADRALSEMKSPIIHGKQCGTAPSEDNDTLFLGNVCNTWTKEAIRQKLKEYGIDGVENITLVGDAKNEGLSRGFAFIQFACHADAMAAYKRLQKPDVIFGHPERTAKVAFAEPLRDPDPQIMAQVKSVFVDGLPPYWDEDHVKEHFKDYGEIERVVLARNMATAKRKDFGFVDFKTHEAAIACIEGVNNTALDDGKTKIKAKARLANPLPKTQAVKGGLRGGFRIGRPGSGYSRFGRGFGRGVYPSNWGGFQRGRGFHPRGRGRTGRFSFPDDEGLEISQPNFRGKRPFGWRGGRRGSFGRTFEESDKEILPRGATSSRLHVDRPMSGAFGRGRGKPFQFRKHPFSPEEDLGRPFGRGHFEDESYLHGGSGHGVKRPFSMMDYESVHYEPGSRLRPRYDYADPLARETLYEDILGTGGGLYSHDYYGSDYGGSSYSSLYGSQSSMGRGYYY